VVVQVEVSWLQLDHEALKGGFNFFYGLLLFARKSDYFSSKGD